jgi:hypothetical protein
LKIILILVPLFLFLTCFNQAEIEFQKLNFSDALQQAQQSGKMILMDFWTDG